MKLIEIKVKNERNKIFFYFWFHPQRRSDPADSLVERIKWLTTDVDDPEVEVEPEAELDDVREAADGISDLDLSHGGVSGERAEAQPAAAAAESAEAEVVPVGAEVAPVKAKSSSEKGAGSTYRKLNELFFRSKSKDKNKADASSVRKSSSLLNRSFSPPPPAEVEPKMKPSIKKSPAHLVHIVGLSGLTGLSKSGETLG